MAVQRHTSLSVFAKEIAIQMRNASLDSYVNNVKTSRSLDASESLSSTRTIACMLNQPHQTRLHSQLQQLPPRLLPELPHPLLFKLVTLEVAFLRILCLSVMETVTTIRNVKVTCNAFKDLARKQSLVVSEM